MSCSRYQLDLSRCLDGRLPGERRTEVMEHVDACPKCTQVWEEMQAAQSIVLGLQEHRVNADFRNEVWDRIHSGEGAPEILLQEPITTATKLRYALIGAAAAAVFAFGLHLLTENGEGSPIQDPHDNDVVQNDDNRRPGPVQPTPIPETLLVAHPLQELAVTTVEKVITAAKRLRTRRPMILEATGRATLPRGIWNEVRDDIRTLDGGLFVLDTLQSKDLVKFEFKTNQCVMKARITLNLQRLDTPQRMSAVIRILGDCPLDNLQGLRITPTLLQMERPHETLVDLFAGNPVFQRWVTDLHLLHKPVFVRFGGPSGSPSPNGRGRLRMVWLKTPQPAQQRTGEKLRKRSRK